MNRQRGRSVALFLIVTALFVLLALVLVLANEKFELHAWLNSRHTPWADVLFSYITHLADGWVPTVIAIVLLLLKDVRSFLMLGISTLGSALIIQFMKRMIFHAWDRPFMFKDELGDMSWVIGLEMNHHFSFPSGHAGCAYSMCFALAVIAGRRGWAVLLALIAALLAFSRVYLSQHFMEDIVAGALIGTIVVVPVYFWLYKSEAANHAKFDRRLLKPRQNQ